MQSESARVLAFVIPASARSQPAALPRAVAAEHPPCPLHQGEGWGARGDAGCPVVLGSAKGAQPHVNPRWSISHGAGAGSRTRCPPATSSEPGQQTSPWALVSGLGCPNPLGSALWMWVLSSGCPYLSVVPCSPLSALLLSQQLNSPMNPVSSSEDIKPPLGLNGVLKVPAHPSGTMASFTKHICAICGDRSSGRAGPCAGRCCPAGAQRGFASWPGHTGTKKTLSKSLPRLSALGRALSRAR